VRAFLEALLAQQRRAGFPALAGSSAAATIPVADGLLNELIAQLLRPDGPVRSLVLHARDRNQIAADVRVVRGTWSVPVSFTLEIDSQPVLPHRPVLGLRLRKSPLLLTIGTLMVRLFAALPPGIAMDGERIEVDLAVLLARYDAAEVLTYLTDLQVSTEPGAVVLSVRARIADGSEAGVALRP
jgi:hypothetical protein